MLCHVSPYLQYVIIINTPPRFSISPICDRHKHSAAFLHISEMFLQSPSSTHFVLCSMEKTQSPISPYTCYGLRTLRYGWLAVVPWSRLFLLHVNGLRARCYGLWASQGQEPSKELTTRTLLILCISPSYFDNRRAAHVPLCSLWRSPSLRSLPTRATGSALCVMGGRLWSWFTPIPLTRARALCSTL